MRARAARAFICCLIAGTSVLAIGRVLLVGGGAAPPAGAAVVPSGVATTRSESGLTVSWMSTESPSTARPGMPATDEFWVTNPTKGAVPVAISPATAVPGNDGRLEISTSTRSAFARVSFSPARFVARPGKTVTVEVTTALRDDVSPGIYLLPAVVEPTPSTTSGNIRIRQEIVALLTYEVPGATHASARGQFLGPRGGAQASVLSSGVAVQFSSTGSEVVRVLDTSKASFYAYLELNGDQSPLGEVSFADHTANDAPDLRFSPSLYFPGRYRDFPVTWHASPLGIGYATLRAFVNYEPVPGRFIETQATTRVLLVSPWWVGAPWLFIAGAGVLTLSRTRRRGRGRANPLPASRARRARRVTASLVTLAVLAALGLVGRPVVVGAACVPAALVLGAFAIVNQQRANLPRWLIVVGAVVTGALLGLAGAAIVLGGLSRWPAENALGLVVGAGAAAVVCWWMSWSVSPRFAPVRARSRRVGRG